MYAVFISLVRQGGRKRVEYIERGGEKGVGGGGGVQRMWGLQGCCNECTAVKKNSVSLPGRERNKGGGGEREMWEEML